MTVAKSSGFTLIEVLIAMAITAFIAVVAYSGLSAVISGVDSVRAEAARLNELSRVFNLLSRDLRQVVNRPVYDEFGSRRSALEGGPLAREMLSFTRAGWHNTAGSPRSALQRVSYYLDDGALVRASWPVLDPATAIEPIETILLEKVEGFEVRFLADTTALSVNQDSTIDRRLWAENWIADISQPGQLAEPPVAAEIRLEIEGGGELERLYVLPPL